MGKCPRWRVLWPLPGAFGFKAPAEMCGRVLAPLYPSKKKSAVGGQTATGAGRVSAPPLSLS